MITLNNFTIGDGRATDNWQNLCLNSVDIHTGKIVTVAVASYATGALGDYPNATKSNALDNINKFIKYITDNDIRTESDWTSKASAKAKTTFAGFFSMHRPFFSSNHTL